MPTASNTVITLTTDYGTSDHLVGAMKGVILSILPRATIVDINHHVTPFDILDGALTIGSAYHYFPPRAIHVVVVDPGVGTERRPILVSGERHYFVAPDNGVLSMVYEREAGVIVRHVNATHYFQNPVSNTFHGRDIFAPVAAWLGKAFQAESFGDEITDYVRYPMPRPKREGNVVKGVVLRADAFGNLLTNLTAEDLPKAALEEGRIDLTVGKHHIEQFAQTFAQGAPGQPLALLGSSNFVEIVVNRGNAVELLGVRRGEAVILKSS